MSSVQYIHNKEEFDNAINDANFNVTIVDFTAHWCGPCKFIGPIFEELSGIHNKIKFIKIDVDELEEVAAACNISAMPTFQVYKNGVIQDQLIGASKDDLDALVRKFSA